ncbi:MAG: type 1 adhesin secretion system outer membrane secretin LapE [Roseibaca calidilacus]|nr:MAG: type 1 adhesin secretion system outer membrane secretin LapE [Roseibaca calidilacus]
MTARAALACKTEHSPRLGQRWRLAVTASGLALTLAGCTGTPMAVTEMSAALSAELAVASAEAGAPVALSEGFASAVARAVETNAGYRAAFAQEREALSQVGVAESVRKPQLSADANLGGLQEFDSEGDEVTGLSGGISLSQLLYDGGESTAAINRATAEALGARAERMSQANALALEVARAWIDVWQFDERVQLLRFRTSEMESMVGQMERMAADGFVDRAALDSARRQIVDVQLEETRLQADLADAQVRFRQHFRQPPGRLSRPAEIVTPAVARAEADAWQNAPSLEARAAGLIAARHGVEEAEAAFRPRIRLQTGLRTPMDTEDPASGNFGLGFDYSFFDGRRRVHQLEAAIARRAAVEDQLRQEQAALEAELAAAVTRLSGIERSMPLVAEQIRLSASEAETSRSQITTGQSTLRQLVEAEVENYRAQDRQIAMRAERQMLLLTIAARTGELGRRIGLPTEQPAEEREARTLASQDQ